MTITDRRDPVPLSTAVAELLADSDRRAAQLDAQDRAWRQGFERGFDAGVEVGTGAALEEEAQQRREAAGLVRQATAGPAHAAVMRRRWTVRGEQRTRETFGNSHPADYPGQGGAS
jgi:hypothetical protein